ncbi:hypothetical protein V1264_019472 [Littorina saxatilis]|uniref:Sjoegren syndrome/scleroderma autoantigen 1 n=2 Tax=Littorina saxatilis TaxID=31220 RepID=A0AAN9BH99_9CAEN
MEGDYDGWQPPSEAEMKLMQARRERSDKISKMMGDYLLKGYKMLGSTCRECDTILLQTKQGVNYCIACSELDSDADKDNPVTNPAAALALAREREIVAVPSTPDAAHSQTSNQRSLLHNSSQFQDAPSGHAEITSTTVPGAPQAVRSQGVTASGFFAGSASSQNQGGTGDGFWSIGRERASDGQKYVKELLDKMDWAVAELRATRNVEYSIQLCQLIKASAEALSSVRAALDS